MLKTKLFCFPPHLTPPQLWIYLFSPVFTTNMTQLSSLNLHLLLLSLTLLLLPYQLPLVYDVPMLLSLCVTLMPPIPTPSSLHILRSDLLREGQISH